MNVTSTYEFCIIVPIYNEEENIKRLAEALSLYIQQASVKTCVLFVNDGSKDASLTGIKEVCSQHEHLYYISFAKNCGLSAAIKAGIDTAESPFVGYIDADLQTSPEDFELLLPYRNNFELVTGIRMGRKDSFVKKLSSRIANNFRRMMTHDGAEDTGCPLKVINTIYAKRIPFFNGMHRFIPALIQLQQGRIKQLPVRHFERIAGQSKFHLWNRLISPLVDCFAYRWMKKRYINYSIESANIK
ncbi:dolichol-phosphate mannosyltransferase [Parabacteroides sp. PF5-5]|uniref:glycosyltransferase n=1 Tax=unclassified Parabacteroides TaxID=2649774 RepID=UPI00247307D1|nr:MULTISPECIES: glycosyltransferase [unclassified Parabacteroides]MDH6304101.1 dolichol-phosphate mannosyltransferase [Parabacteroides sp. PH5-39]MDH6315199.1 dolichol-phosphate mannosyltransferase [Parabacteroides sp. PF5-13]MDH6318844.1 dolichol-phosphate mannosyltransferase [Parabacteroides sp. PH5-13]MDH6322573.1 dolichol-phosphate mannosyltransferase [Parabacteroides sp. PH5-8]MDH6326275.1 dolichol-phosphate mannosyltransferase [Parabacteroides sp. PH5-41]